MENKGETGKASDERSELDERRTRFDEGEEDGKLREVKREFVTECKRKRKRKRENFVDKRERALSREG